MLYDSFFINYGHCCSIRRWKHCKIRNKLEAWFVFLSDDNPETIVRLLEMYKKHKSEIAQLMAKINKQE